MLTGLAVCVALSACVDAGADNGTSNGTTPPVVRPAYSYGDAPVVDPVTGADARAAFARVVERMVADGTTVALLADLVAAGDARYAWLVSDLMRFSSDPDEVVHLAGAFEELTSVDPSHDPTFVDSPWKSVTDHLIAWDLEAPPGYRETKASLYTTVEPRWAPFFADADAEVDWRWMSWGGVLIDDRPLGSADGCVQGCIPALDDPALTPASLGDWYPDDAIVFGIVEGDEVVALPKNIMEVHELVNMTLGGRRLGIPYCTLCGSAQAYFTDGVPVGTSVPVLRTTGLLSRSNKVMYDLRTMSLFDTFTGAAVSGPLQDAGVVLEQDTVTVATWGDWKAAHPDTRLVAEDGGVGRSYPRDPLGGRDDDGPIFPTGEVDPRLPAQEPVVGVVTADGTTLAFAAHVAREVLERGGHVTLGGVELEIDGGGLRARTTGGADVAAHEAFWFAWSQFHPDTQLWRSE